MRQTSLNYHKVCLRMIWMLLGILFITSVSSAGDTFSIVQGFSDEKISSLSFELTFGNETVSYQDDVQIVDGKFATVITIPDAYGDAETFLHVYVDGTRYGEPLALQVGETLLLDLRNIDAQSSSHENISVPLVVSDEKKDKPLQFEPEGYEEMIDDLKKGETTPYEGLFEEVVRPSISPSGPVEESPSVYVIRPSSLERLDAFFVHPVVLVMLMIVILGLIVAILAKK